MSENISPIVEPLLQWFEINQRELPWRKDREPYHIWVSEIMLQQTRIEAVKKYYVNFMHHIPNIETLSTVPDDQLLKLWEGLGYYSRAKNLKKAAQVIMQNYHGNFPDSYEQLLQLPGIGEYTAGAIASICFNEKVPAVDGNVLRVMARVLGNKNNVLLPETKKTIRQTLQNILPEQSGNFNQALMELGEIICLPNTSPDCQHCPIQKYCIACQENLTDKIPVRIKKLKRTKEEKTVFLLVADGKVAIEKRTEQGLLSGMYQFPNISGFHSDETLTAILQDLQITPLTISFIKKAKHTFTHIDWYMKGYLITVRQPCGSFLWVSPQELSEKYPLPTAFKPFSKTLQ